MIHADQLSKTYRVPEKQNWLKSLFVPKYKLNNAVDSISFDIDAGEAVGFLGPNGAGKTTTIKMLTGLLYPTSGSVSVLGFKPTKRDPSFLSQIGLVMGNKTGLSWDLSPMQSYELIKVIYSLDNIECRNTIKELAEMLEVKDVLDVPIRKHSLGQRMKVELIGAILHKPKVLFLDEPTLGLDVIAQKRIREFLNYLNKDQGTTILLTSHNMDDIEDVCERVMIINQGRIIFDDLLEKLKLKYRDIKFVTFIFKKKVDRTKLEKFGTVVQCRDLSCTIEIPAKDQSSIVSKVMKNFPVDDIDIMSPPLDEIIRDIFLKKSAGSG